MRVEKVKFKDGTYGIRKTNGIFNLKYVYRDLVSVRTYYWGSGDQYYKDCKGEESAVDILIERDTDIGTPV